MSTNEPTIFNGRYELHRVLGRGGMAEVYLARDQLLDRPVAVKVLFPSLASDAGFVERFRREAQAAANLNHPNIVGVYDWGETQADAGGQAGTYFIVMEYVEGRTLGDILRSEGPLHPDRAADIGADVAAALGFAHRNGVVHRDIKPGNVLITSGGQVKLADFGIGRVLDNADHNLTQTGLVMGTATYFSPEQAQGQAVDPRSDLYSLGCVLYEMTTGRPPFSGDSPVAIAFKHVQESPEPPSRLTPELPTAMEAIILKCLAKNPANRYPSAEDLRADLRRFRQGQRILAESVMAPPVDPGATGLMAATAATPAATTATRAVTMEEYVDDRPERRSTGAFIAVLLGLLIVLGALLFLLAQLLGVGDEDDPETALVAVPDVVNQNVDDAREQLINDNFDVEVEFEENDEFEANIVFAQNPDGGMRVDEGSTVVLRVSQGAAAVEVPDVVGRTEEEARQILQDAQLQVRSEPRETEDEEPGTVLDQDPDALQEVPRDTTVVITVAASPEEKPVPDVAGQTVAEASNAITAEGFNVAQRDEASDDVEAGRVIRTEPGSGTQLAVGETVTLIVSTGPDTPECVVPGVDGRTEASARSLLSAAGFTSEPSVTFEEVAADDPNDGRVISHSPDGTQPCDRVITLIVGQAVEEVPIN